MTAPDSNALIVRDEDNSGALQSYEMTTVEVAQQVAAIQKCMEAVMRKDEHYGVIPGTPKPSLWQPGAQKLCLMFRLDPHFEDLSVNERDDFISYRIRCTLKHIVTGQKVGEGVGACNSREKKYREQTTVRKCPKCGKAGTIIKGKEEYGGGWICFAKKGGCGAKFADNAKEIVEQRGEADINAVWDLQNTLYKMAAKRSLVAATLNATAASDIFAQDIEDLAEYLQPQQPAQKPRSFRAAPENPNAGRATPKWGAEHAEQRTPAPETTQQSADAPPQGEPQTIDTVERVDSTTGEAISVPSLTRAQQAKIKVLQKKCGIPEDDWKARLTKHFGVDSSAKLSKSEAGDLIDRLERLASRAEDAIRSVGDALSGAGVDMRKGA